MPVTNRQRLLAMTAAAALIAFPAVALAQGSAGTSRMPQTTQTTPQEGPMSGTPGGRAAGNAGQGTTQTIPGNNAGAPRTGEAPDRQVPEHMRQSGGHTSTQGQETQGQGGQGQGSGGGGSGAANPGGSVGNTQAPRDNAPGNPPSPNAPGRRSDAGPAGAEPSRAAATGAGASAAGALAAVDSASMRDARRASRVIGSAVYNENNESIGEVDDIVIPTNGGAPVAVVSVGGFLGIGAKLVAVPYERLRMNGERNRWTLTGSASRDDLNRLPTFSYDSTAGRG